MLAVLVLLAIALQVLKAVQHQGEPTEFGLGRVFTLLAAPCNATALHRRPGVGRHPSTHRLACAT